MKVNELPVMQIYPSISRPTFQALHAPLDIRYPFPAFMPVPSAKTPSDKPEYSVYLTVHFYVHEISL